MKTRFVHTTNQLPNYQIYSNHLGNVLTFIGDKRFSISAGGVSKDYYVADIVNANDYYPFGMTMPGRTYSSGNGYRYGFNGKEKDNETAGTTTYDYGFRIYNPALGKFLSVDPLASTYAWFTPYQFAGNKPIMAIDLDGKEEWIANFIDFMTKAPRTIAKLFDITLTASITFEAQEGIAPFYAKSTKKSLGVAIDAVGNIGFSGTSVSFWDVFGLMGGVSSRKPGDVTEEVQYVNDGGMGVEFGAGVSLNSHIMSIAGSSKNIEFGGELGVGLEGSVGTNPEGTEVQSLEIAATLGPGVPINFSVLNSNTVLIGTTSKNLAEVGDAVVKATSTMASLVIQAQVTGKNANYNVNRRKNVDQNGNINIFVEVLETDLKTGKVTTLFSRKAISLIPNNTGDYLRTAEVKATEPLEK